MSDREAQVNYYKQTIVIYSTGLFVSLGSVTAAIVQLEPANRAGAMWFIGMGGAVFVTSLILFVRDNERFKRIVGLTK